MILSEHLSVTFLFVQCVASTLVYYVLFKLETECRVINFLFVLFWSGLCSFIGALWKLEELFL